MKDFERLRKDFPLLARQQKGVALAYLDNASTTQKPTKVLEAMDNFYKNHCANVHRGAYALSEEASALYEQARKRVQRFFNAAKPQEIVFTKNATEAVNLVAASLGKMSFKPGDEVLVSQLEHHANFIPWQMAAETYGAILKPIPLMASGQIDLEGYVKALSPKTKVVAITAASNVLGVCPPLQDMIPLAHGVGAKVLVDGCQWSPHCPTDVQALGADFFVVTGHKLLGPNGIGVLYGRKELLDQMPPYQGGGGMIERVSFERTTYRPSPERFEAGTPPVAEAVGLMHALDYLEGIGWEAIQTQESHLSKRCMEELRELPFIRVMGQIHEGAPVVSFVMEGVHPHDLSTYLDSKAIAVRSGHHCAQPLMQFLKVPATVRASFAFYNRIEEVERLLAALTEAHAFFN
jgi:cysteine desulfurase/selenocysteine lyase